MTTKTTLNVVSNLRVSYDFRGSNNLRSRACPWDVKLSSVDVCERHENGLAFRKLNLVCGSDWTLVSQALASIDMSRACIFPTTIPSSD